MIFKFLTLLLICFSFSFSLQNAPTADWQTINLEGQFSFRLPPGFVKHSLTGAEDVVAEYVNGQTKLIFVWGSSRSLPYRERQQPWMKEYQETVTRIRGKRANIRGYWRRVNGKRIYKAELNVGNWQNGEVELFMSLEGSAANTLQLANAIFSSVIFPIPPPERSCLDQRLLSSFV